MRLADFIRANREPILVEWEAFARTCAPSGSTMDVAALRDHADRMLTAIAADLATPQGSRAQAEKSKGQAPDAHSAAPTAAGEHGAGRAESGFSVAQMVAEYRALRASVIRLWMQAQRAQAAQGAHAAEEMEDLTRFNEAIDQALAESVTRFEEDVEQAKETFIAILGHDLRLPLAAISTSASFMLEAGALEETNRTLVVRIAASARRTMGMVGELLDFTRSRLGGGIPVVRGDTDLAEIAREAADEVRAAYPGHEIRVDSAGARRGRWDSARLSQALGNLIGNAVQHGRDGAPVTVEVREEGADQVAVAVHNAGAVIPSDQLDGIFNPMKARHTLRPADRGPTGSLGLGLYIAERIVDAHGGHIAVESAESQGTTFTVYLPRGEARSE